MLATTKTLTCSILAISFCSFVVLSQQTQPGSQSNQRTSAAEVAEESQLNASLVELYKAGKFDEALPVARRLLELREKMFGPEDPVVGIALSNLAEIFRAKKQNDEAQRLYRRSLGILERDPAANSLSLIDVLERLADFAFEKRDYKGSSAFLARALGLKEAAVGKDDPSLIPLLHHFANTLQAQRQFDQAEPIYLRSLTIAEQRLGKRAPETISMMKDYACLALRARQPYPRGPQEEPETDEPGAAARKLERRATCWLYGFTDNCETYPEAIQKVDKVVNGRAVSLPKPAYPIPARQERAAGTVFVAVLIDGEGKVTQAKTVCGGPPLLQEAATVAARGAKFTPTTVGGKPKEVFGVITYNFVRQ
ncbi:MAG TPA: TonB family protein [Pyrinomonadaceae bacterium]|nr:TonB family protein [Pyrinomonadaceae bacterium]